MFSKGGYHGSSEEILLKKLSDKNQVSDWQEINAKISETYLKPKFPLESNLLLFYIPVKLLTKALLT